MLWCAQVSTDWVGLIDEWARRFFHELDYDREARSAMQFQGADGASRRHHSGTCLHRADVWGGSHNSRGCKVIICN